MKLARKKEKTSSSSRQSNRKGKKSKSNIKRSPSKKRSLVKRVGRSTKKNIPTIPVRITKQRKRGTSKAKSTNRSIGVRATRKIGVEMTRKSSPRLRRNLSKKQTLASGTNKKIIRVLGHGQFSVDSETLRKLNAIDNSIVRKIEKENLTDEDFKMILPGSDLTIEEASKIFHGEGIIPGLD